MKTIPTRDDWFWLFALATGQVVGLDRVASVIARQNQNAGKSIQRDSDEFYILSISNSPVDSLALWWRPDDCGYTTQLVDAGKYRRDRIELHANHYDDGHTTRAVPCEMANLKNLIVGYIHASEVARLNAQSHL